MKNLKKFENFHINEGLITLSDDEMRQLENLLPKIEGAILSNVKGDPKYFESPGVIDYMDIFTKKGRDQKIGIVLSEDEDDKGSYDPRPRYCYETETFWYAVEINKKFFKNLPKEGGKLSPTSRSMLRNTLIHEIIHAKDPNVTNIKDYKKSYFAREQELKAWVGSYIQSIELAVDKFVNDGIKSQEDLNSVENILRDFVKSFGEGGMPKFSSGNFRLTNSLEKKGIFSRLFWTLKNYKSLDHEFGLKKIKKENPEGFRDFQKNLFIRLKRCEEKINKAISDSGLNFKPISITKGKYS